MSVLDEVINQASVKEMLDYYRVEKQGKLYVCPFHNDTHASLSVTDDDKHWQCFTCGEHGNIDNLVEKMERLRGNDMDYVHRIDMIIKLQHLNIEFVVNEGRQQSLSPEQRRLQRMYDIMRDAMMLGENGLKDDTDKIGVASRYLADRGISKDTIKAFHIGYNSESLLQDNLSSKYDENELYAVGVIAKADNGRYYDHQYDRLIIPILNNEGKCVAFGGRYLGDTNANNGRNKAKYKNTKVTEIFKKSQILFNYNLAKRYTRQANELFVVEGYFDAISAYEMGMKNTVALMGVELTQEHMQLVKELNVPVTLCLDNDEAGKTAMYKIVPELISEGIDVSVIDTQSLNKGKDMNDFLVSGVTKDNLVANKISGVEFMIKETLSLCSNGEVTLDNIQKAYKEIFKSDVLNNSGNEVRFFEYVTKNYDYSRADVEAVCKPLQNKKIVTVAMQNYFCVLVKSKLLSYAEQTNNNTLQSFIMQKRLRKHHIIDGMNDEKYIQNNGRTFLFADYCKDYLFNTEEYKAFEKEYDADFEKLLNNVFVLDKQGQQVKLDHLTAKQKDIVMQQYNESFGDEEKQYVKENIDRFIKLYIADNSAEAKAFLGSNCPLPVRDSSLKRYNNGNMSLVNYQAILSESEMDNYHKTAPTKFTTENGKRYQCVLMFNNSDNKLNLTPDNYISKTVLNDDYEYEEENAFADKRHIINNGVNRGKPTRQSPIERQLIHNQETGKPTD